jgi:hypothetical protein
MAAMRNFYEGVLGFAVMHELRQNGSNIGSATTLALVVPMGRPDGLPA